MSSAACTSRCQRSQVSPSCPSIMMPTRMTWPPVVFGIPVGSRALMYTATAGRVPRDKLCFAAAMAPSQRLLLLIPTTTYRTEDFVAAARSLDVDLLIASDRPNVMATEFPDHLLTLPFADPAAAAREMRRYAARRPIDAVVPVDDATTVVASAVGEALGLRVNPLAAAQATRDKQVMRELLRAAGVPSPSFIAVRVDEDPAAAARRAAYPCVLKPRVLSASRGVIRADDEAAFVAACALGLSDGAVHCELRLRAGKDGALEPVVLEIAARSIGGLCGRTLRFGTGMSLEELILRRALGRPVDSLERERTAAAVMMIPIPRAGILEEVRGLDAARAVPQIEDVTISLHKGQEVVPLPEGSRYLGFIFSRAAAPTEAEAALRAAHRHLQFVIR